MRRKGKKLINSKKNTYNGIKFASQLEIYMYKALKSAKIKASYEGKTYVLTEGFVFPNKSYERTKKSGFKDRGGKKLLPIKYTPDFIGDGFIIECKGWANGSFPIRWKLFKNYMAKNEPDVWLFKPQNKRDCDEVIEILKNF